LYARALGRRSKRKSVAVPGWRNVGVEIVASLRRHRTRGPRSCWTAFDVPRSSVKRVPWAASSSGSQARDGDEAPRGTGRARLREQHAGWSAVFQVRPRDRRGRSPLKGTAPPAVGVPDRAAAQRVAGTRPICVSEISGRAGQPCEELAAVVLHVAWGRRARRVRRNSPWAAGHRTRASP